MVAVIPTFSPPSELLDLAKVLAGNVAAVVVSDDASPCTSDRILREVAGLSGVQVIRHGANAGIARALNEGLELTRDFNAQWLLTVDQDSMVVDSYVAALVDEAHERLAGGERLGALGAAVIEDVSGPMTYPLSAINGRLVTEEVIQTGTLWNVAALRELSGFDTSMGMDAVDAAACLSLRRSGFVVGVAEDLTVQHAIGHSTSLSVGGRKVMVTGHSPERRASMLRNRLRLLPREFAASPRHAIRTIRRVAVNQALGLLIEDGRWEKAKGTARGLIPSRGR